MGRWLSVWPSPHSVLSQPDILDFPSGTFLHLASHCGMSLTRNAPTDFPIAKYGTFIIWLSSFVTLDPVDTSGAVGLKLVLF